jgi:hypothetical protein
MGSFTSRRPKKFPKHKYLDFPTFKYLYEGSNLPKWVIKEYPADKVWFAITTFIRGYEVNTLVNSENYEDCVKRDLRVLLSLEDLKGTEKNCLSFYQKLIDGDYWDKLKIIRYIEENIQITKKYAVIFCDEAQDFSRVELNFILKLSEYTQYDLKDTPQVPIVFAGDPHQTVNPTGFREKEIKDILYNQLNTIANFPHSPNDSLYSPDFNYRSSEKVVGLANYIQYFRKKRLNLPITKPQEAKRLTYQNIANNIFQYPEEITNDSEFLEKFRYKVFIVPVDGEDEKQTFIENNPLLSALPNLDIKTSVEAKGVEYPQVVLYGFGEYFLQNFGSLEMDDDIDNFKCRYFFNKLYVGATRAQTELIIIDSPKAEEEFWKKLTEKSNSRLPNWENIDKPEIILYHAGTVKVQESTKEDALENARKDKEQGKFDKNPNRLKIAASQFFALGEYDEQRDCLALAEEFIGNWEQAAEYYSKMKNGAEKQAEALWKGKLLKELLVLGIKVNNEQQAVRIALARLISDERINTPIIKDLYQYKNVLKNITKEIAWRGELIEKLSKVSENIEKEFVRDFCDVLEEVVQPTDNNLYEALGYLYQKAGYYDKAISSWDSGGYTDNKDYINAMIQNAQYKRDVPTEIIYQDKMLAYDTEKATEIRARIIHLYTTDTPKDNPWSLLAAYKAFLVQQPKHTQIIQIAQDTERAFENFLETLAFEYESILRSSNLDKQVAEFVIERWAKNIAKNSYNTKITIKLRNKYVSIA